MKVLIAVDIEASAASPTPENMNTLPSDANGLSPTTTLPWKVR